MGTSRKRELWKDDQILRALLQWCLEANHGLTLKMVKKQLDWLKDRIETQIGQLEGVASALTDLEQAEFDGRKLTAKFRVINEMDISGEPPFPPEESFQRMAEQARMMASTLQRKRSLIARYLGVKGNTSVVLVAVYEYCCAATKRKVSPGDIANRLDWAKKELTPHLTWPDDNLDAKDIEKRLRRFQNDHPDQYQLLGLAARKIYKRFSDSEEGVSHAHKT